MACSLCPGVHFKLSRVKLFCIIAIALNYKKSLTGCESAGRSGKTAMP
jgi:hypothetical protein